MRICIFCILLSGCMVGPNYKAPENDVSLDWKGVPSSVEASLAEPVTDWWTTFDEPLLNKYIELATHHNKDVLAAEANILQARGLRTVAASALFPQVAADFNAIKTYFSKNGPLFVQQPTTTGAVSTSATGTPSSATGLPFGVQIPQIQSLYTALFDSTWEIDLFGRTRRAVQAAKANIQTAIEQRNDVLISVFAEIGRNYMELRSNQTLKELILQNIEILEKNANIAQMQFDAGLHNELDLDQILAELATARSKLPDVYAGIYLNIYSLSILTGQFPEALVDELLITSNLPKPPKTIAIGLRSDLLRRRPDVRRSERQLAAATANLGVAVAKFFPSITLLGDGGVQSLKIGNLFTAHSRTWAVGGDINLPIFQGGNLIGNLRANRAATQTAAENYQSVVLSALKEAEGSLITYTQDLKTAMYLWENTEWYRELVRLTRERYEKGLVPLTDLLQIELQLNTSEQNLLASDTTALVDLVALYKAIGGGWECINH